MGAQKLVEVYCDECSHAQHYAGSNIAHAIQYAVSLGWIVNGKLHFCTTDCQLKYYKDSNTMQLVSQTAFNLLQDSITPEEG